MRRTGSVVSCPSGEHTFDVDQTATGGETKSKDEPSRRECMPSIAGRLARRGEDSELQCGDQGEGGPAGP